MENIYYYYNTILENSPDNFKKLLEGKYNSGIQAWVNGDSKTHQTWYSPCLIVLYLLTGKLVNKKKQKFFGSNTEIDQHLACEIFDLLIKYNPNPHDKDYFNENLFDNMKNKNKDTLTYRTNNEIFIEHVKKHYENLI